MRLDVILRFKSKKHQNIFVAIILFLMVIGGIAQFLIEFEDQNQYFKEILMASSLLFFVFGNFILLLINAIVKIFNKKGFLD